MRIVVPTDFSSTAKIGSLYAVEFAKQIKADLVLLHVLPSLGPTLGTVSTSHLKEDMVAWAQGELKSLTEELKTDDVSIKYQIAYGASVQDVIETFTITHAVDLIIMSSKGASGLKRILLGSNTVGVINNCSTPVIVIPERVAVCHTHTLIYASDLKYLVREVKYIIPYANALDAIIKIIHVPVVHDQEQLDSEILINDLMLQTGFQKFKFQVINGEDIATAIEQYTDENTGELLVMFTHHVNFLDQLFSKSITREIAWHNKTPLLVINNR